MTGFLSVLELNERHIASEKDESSVDMAYHGFIESHVYGSIYRISDQ